MTDNCLDIEQQTYNEILDKTIKLFFDNSNVNDNDIQNILDRFNIDVHYDHELLLATAIASENYIGIRLLLALGAEPNLIRDNVCKYELKKDYILIVDGICRSFGKTFNINNIHGNA